MKRRNFLRLLGLGGLFAPILPQVLKPKRTSPEIIGSYAERTYGAFCRISDAQSHAILLKQRAIENKHNLCRGLPFLPYSLIAGRSLKHLNELFDRYPALVPCYGNMSMNDVLKYRNQPIKMPSEISKELSQEALRKSEIGLRLIA
jgi:hypothetical protein